MAYCTRADIDDRLSVDELIGLTDDAGLGIPDEARITKAQADADAEIDSYCAKLYVTPLSPVPAVITKLAADITVYNLYALRQGAPDGRKQRYQDAIALLKLIAKGEVALGGAATPENAASTSTPQVSHQARVFDRDTLEHF